MMKNTEKTMDKIVALCKGRGFIYLRLRNLRRPGQHLGLRPPGCGAEKQCQKGMVEKIRAGESRTTSGMDCAILMNPQTWVASGHLGGFSDPLMDCKACKERFRADKLIEDFCQGEDITLPKPIDGCQPAGNGRLHRGKADSPAPPAASMILPTSASST